MNDHNKLVIFQDKKIRRIWHNKEWYYSVIDIVRALTDSVNARDYWYKMKVRLNAEEKAELSTICLQLKMPADDGKLRQTDCADKEGIFRIIQSILVVTENMDLNSMCGDRGTTVSSLNIGGFDDFELGSFLVVNSNG